MYTNPRALTHTHLESRLPVHQLDLVRSIGSHIVTLATTVQLCHNDLTSCLGDVREGSAGGVHGEAHCCSSACCCTPNPYFAASLITVFHAAAVDSSTLASPAPAPAPALAPLQYNSNSCFYSSSTASTASSNTRAHTHAVTSTTATTLASSSHLLPYITY